MDLKNEREVANTREKLQRLEALYEGIENQAEDDEELREIELESLMRTINQFKEEIARFEARQPALRTRQ